MKKLIILLMCTILMACGEQASHEEVPNVDSYGNLINKIEATNYTILCLNGIEYLQGSRYRQGFMTAHIGEDQLPKTCEGGYAVTQ